MYLPDFVDGNIFGGTLSDYRAAVTEEQLLYNLT